ncbi:MAG: UDP-N-acetylmuramoyl-L-alanine--D-glutamate ligase [Christensenellales bacterium]|jgi:UDP-N-acetylmuramoylalanine--D-glutamate ligase
MAWLSDVKYPDGAAWFAGKRVMVVGMARSGLAAVQLLTQLGAHPVATDSKTEEQLSENFAQYGRPDCACFFGVDPIPLLSQVQAAVISPAVPVDSALVRSATAAGIPVIAELELGYLASNGCITAVTGTNGKTTTVSLLGHILKEAGRTALVCGNIGYPISAAVLEGKPEAELITEVSSFQMETSRAFHPRVGVLLNITPDHLNRHHDMDTYVRLKYKMFANQTGQDLAVLNWDDPLCRKAQGHTQARVAWFSCKEPVAEGAYEAENMLYLAHNGQRQAVCSTKELLIPGRHNVMNALAAIVAAHAIGIAAEAIAAALRTFPGVEHRIEYVTDIGGVRYINDSKGTNPDSTMRAVEAMDRPTILLLGGQEKDIPFDEMADCIVKSSIVRHAVLMGETAKAIERSLRGKAFDAISHAATLEEAVSVAASYAQPGDAMLLSPACASFDMFKDYEDRGRQFKRIVQERKENGHE